MWSDFPDPIFLKDTKPSSSDFWDPNDIVQGRICEHVNIVNVFKKLLLPLDEKKLMTTHIRLLIEQLKYSEIEITLAADGYVRCWSPSPISEEFTTLIRQHKREIVEFLIDRESKQPPSLPNDSKERRPAATTRRYSSSKEYGPPLLRTVWCPERGWFEWNPASADHDIPLIDEDRLEMFVAQDERDAIQSEGGQE